MNFFALLCFFSILQLDIPMARIACFSQYKFFLFFSLLGYAEGRHKNGWLANDRWLALASFGAHKWRFIMDHWTFKDAYDRRETVTLTRAIKGP